MQFAASSESLSMFEAEASFEYAEKRRWLQANWIYTVPVAALYLGLLFAGQSVMRTRPAFGLRTVLFLWNLALALFSAIGTTRTMPEFLATLREGGLHRAICDEGSLKRRGPFGYWVWLFTLSKLFELGDSVLLVLRKRPLLFIHYYHHASVLVFTWYTNSQSISCGRWYLVMNYAVHAVMYAYYATRTLGLSFPKWIPMIITGLQVTQMLVGFWVTLYAFARHWSSEGPTCDTTMSNAMAGLFLYGSYFVLFFRLFRNSYFARSDSARYEQCPQASSAGSGGGRPIRSPPVECNAAPFRANGSCPSQSSEYMAATRQRTVRACNGINGNSSGSHGNPATASPSNGSCCNGTSTCVSAPKFEHVLETGHGEEHFKLN